MFTRILTRMREHIRKRRYVMTLHAEEEMDEDALTIYDVESIILTGKIVDRRKNQVSAEWKYEIAGRTINNEKAMAIAKLSSTNVLVIITVFRPYRQEECL